MSGTLLVRCERCGAAAGLSVYDDLLNRLESRHESRAAAYAELGRLIRPCECGGLYSVFASTRCEACGLPVDEAAYQAQTGQPWRDNYFFGPLHAAEWRKFCSNCGTDNETVEPADTARPHYICANCRANAA